MTDHPTLFKPVMVRALLEDRKFQTRRILKPQPFIDKMGNFCTPSNDSRSGGHWNWGQHVDGRPCVRNFVDGLPIKVGDRLWVKETWRPHSLGDTDWNLEVEYAADGKRMIINDGEFGDNDWHWPKAAERGNVSPLFMPRWASRITLPVTNVRVERIQKISVQDAIAEGIIRDFSGPVAGWSGISGVVRGDAINAFRDLWDSINAKPRAVKGEDGEVSHYESYPWGGLPRTETYRGKPHHIHPNPWVAAYTFDVIKGNIDRNAQVAA